MHTVSLPISILRPLKSHVKSVLHINIEVVIMHVWSANGYYSPGETYGLQVNQLP